MADTSKKLGLGGLVAIVFGSMIGGGIFNISQNMAQGAGLGATLISWVISGVGVLFLVLNFKVLADARPDLNAGIYQYAKEGFGNYVGFNIAWGYWLCAAMGNVAFAVMLNDSFGEFFPVLLHHGWQTVVFGSFFIWAMYFIVARGVKAAAALNTIVTIVKFAALILIVIILFIFFKIGALSFDFWGHTPDLGSIGAQVKSTMLVTLWCFIGVEGAVVMSAHARNSKDVGKAGVIGFLLALVLYALISVLSYGIMHQPELAKLDDPSVAYVLKHAVGEWAYTFVVLSVIVSVIGGWIAWTLMCAQVPYTAAQVKILPKSFLRENKKSTPIYALLISSIIMQVFMVMVAMAKSVYDAAIDITGVMILPAYLFCGIYLVKASFMKGELNTTDPKKIGQYRFIGIVSSLFCLWLLYAGGLLLLLVTSIFYLVGIYFYVVARKQNRAQGELIFSPAERWLALAIAACSVIAVILLIEGKVGL